MNPFANDLELVKKKKERKKKPEGREADLGRQRQVGMAAVIEIV